MLQAQHKRLDATGEELEQRQRDREKRASDKTSNLMAVASNLYTSNLIAMAPTPPT